MTEPAPAATLTTQQFVDLGRIPDFVREIQPFNGNPTELANWLADVDSVFRVYREKGATSFQISLMERAIRRKLTGEAADILNANNITTKWSDIKNTLILYYRDKRDIKTLDYELTSIRKLSSENLSSYYSRVNELLSLVIAQIQTDEKMNNNAAAHTDYFRDKALDAFIRGLERPLSILLKTTNPKTLSQAYQFCVDYYNMDTRTAPYRNEFGGLPTPKPREPPKIPHRLPIPAPRQPVPPLPLPRSFPINPFQNINPTHRPFQPNPFKQNNPFYQQPPPEHMEIDPYSLRTRNINYSNRPPLNMKRPRPPSQQTQPFKRQAHPLEDYNLNPDHEQFENHDEQQQYDHYDYSQFADSQYQEPFEMTYPYTDATNEQSVEQATPQTANFLEWLPRW